MPCMYCEKGEKLNNAAIKICDLQVSELYLNREQSYPGRLILVLKSHTEELYELSQNERTAFINDICSAAKAMEDLYHPGRINYGMYGDNVKHIHVHIVPKTKDGLDWNGVFQMNPRKTYLADDEYMKIVKAYKEKLEVLK